MTRSSATNRKLKFTSTWFFKGVAIAMTLFSGHVLAKSDGIAGFSGKTPGKNCTDCHSSGAAVPTVSFGGANPGTAASTSVAAGSNTTYTLAIKGGPAQNASLDVAASGGQLAAVSAGTQLMNAEIVHTVGASFPVGGAVFSFNWRAPSVAGTYTLYGAGLSSNGSGSKGDGTGTASLQVTVTAGGPVVPQKPVAVIVAPSSGVAGSPVSLDGSNSRTVNGGTLAAYDWDFGDGSAGSGVKVSHSYVAGTYTAMLKVMDSAGVVGTATTGFFIAAVGTSAVTASAGGPYTAQVGVPIRFDASASGAPGGAISTYAWNFGDNTSGTGVKPTHSYAAIGLFTAKVTVTDNVNKSASASAAVTISSLGTTPNPPTGSPSAVGAPRVGQRLYDDNCASCHGPTGAELAGEDGNIIGAKSKEIRESITEVAVMNTAQLRALSRSDIRAISNFLRGEKLYQENCELCHGVGGVGTDKGVALIGRTRNDIQTAIDTVPVMDLPNLRDLSRRQLDLIAFFLPRDPAAASASGGLHANALGSKADSESDYPELAVEDDAAAPVAPVAAKVAGALGWFGLGAFAVMGFRLRRRIGASRS